MPLLVSTSSKKTTTLWKKQQNNKTTTKQKNNKNEEKNNKGIFQDVLEKNASAFQGQGTNYLFAGALPVDFYSRGPPWKPAVWYCSGMYE